MKKVSFSWDFIAASAIVLALVGFFLAVLPASSQAVAQQLAFAEKQRSALLEADWRLKNCFPEGIAKCENGFLYSHRADGRAKLSFGSGGFCVKRLVLQNGAVERLVVCK